MMYEVRQYGGNYGLYAVHTKYGGITTFTSSCPIGLQFKVVDLNIEQMQKHMILCGGDVSPVVYTRIRRASVIPYTSWRIIMHFRYKKYHSSQHEKFFRKIQTQE